MAYQFTQTGAEIQDILDLAQLQIAAPYDSASSYTAGDYCTKGDGFYVCTASTSGTWDGSKWSAVTVGDVLETANANISSLNATLTQFMRSLYYQSGDVINATLPCYGFVTGGAGTLDLYFSLPKLIPSNASFTASSVGFGGLRISSGGYIPTQPTVSEITQLVEVWGVIHLRAVNSGTGVTNNTPVTGTIQITMTMN